MPEKPGFQIGSRFYPFPSSFRLGDPILVEELTGLDWNAFLERLPEEDDPEAEAADPAAMLGLVGVAVWQQNPRWRRDKVVRYVQGLAMDAIEAVGDDGEEDEASPPDPAEAAEPEPGQPDSESSASSSRSESEPPSDPSSPTGSGTSTSAT